MVRVWRSVSIMLGSVLVVGSAVPVVAQPATSGDVDMPEASVEAAVESEELPSLRSGLPRRLRSDVPHFVGPATLRLDGRHGTYAWDEVRFGAQEVAARVAAVPGDDACTVRLRLKDDGESLADEWFTATAGEKATHLRVIDVDYLTGQMRIVSDCKRWSVILESPPDPDLRVEIEERYYPVKGNTIEKLASQSDHIKGKWTAYTEWYTTWTWRTEQADDGTSCETMDGQTLVEVRLTYPNWKRPKDADPVVEAAWQTMLTNLRTHELGHVTIALQGADAIDDRLDRGLTASSCAKAEKRADAVATKIFDRYADASRRYDDKTDHGLTQGTGLG